MAGLPIGTALLFVTHDAHDALHASAGHLEEVPLLPGMFAGSCCGTVYQGKGSAWEQHQHLLHPSREVPGHSRWVFPQVPRKLDKVEVAWLGHTVTMADPQRGTFYVWAIAPAGRLWLIDNKTGRLLDRPVGTYEVTLERNQP